MGTETEKKYWLGLSQVPGVGPVRFRRLLERFGDARRAWQALPSELRDSGLEPATVDALVESRQRGALDEALEKVSRVGAEVVTGEDQAYPPRLREIPDPPPVLYVKGELTEEDAWAVAVVGTRTPRPYGRAVAQDLAAGLAASGLTVVSGLARGIDSLAHEAALETGGRTIAVLGSGIDRIYPPEHRSLARRIEGSGAVVTEFPPGTAPEASHFPRRNRIISGISLGTVVVEAGDRSGALITADYALEQGREVFAVPGSVRSPKSRGTNRLIQEGGAKLTVGVSDILEELNLELVEVDGGPTRLPPRNAAEVAIFGEISEEPLHVDEIGRATGMSIAEVTSALTLMELKGMVRQVGGMHYVVAGEPQPAYRVE